MWLRDAANINPGPHSIDDPRIIQTIVDGFVAEGEEAGLSREQLERSLGDVRVFLQSASDDAKHARRT